ncbi:MAG TPA: hypothetical protein VFC00_21270 [Micromonosporaceae bacterium]|nr:hypothetical protein [Micromonosporaceae bacterium]
MADLALRHPSRPAGRHRLGTPGLRPCRELCQVAERPPWIGPRALVQGSIRSARLAAVVVVLGTLAVSSWFAAAGATAFADMIHP